MSEFLFIAASLAGYAFALAVSKLVEPATGTWVRMTFPGFLFMGAGLYWLKQGPPGTMTLRPERLQRALMWSSAVLTGLVLLSWVSGPGTASRAPRDTTLVYGLGLVLVSPFAEEPFFRGVCMNHFLRGSLSPLMASLITSALFVLFHMPRSPAMAAALLGISLVLCLIALVSRSVAWPIVFHIGWNALVANQAAVPDHVRLVQTAAALAAMCGMGAWASKTAPERDPT